MAETGTYLYAVCRDVPDTPEITGVAGAPVRTVEHDGLTAYVSTVDLAEFGTDALRRNLEDLAWLERVAREHQRVVDTVGLATTCAPLRMATIFLGDEKVREELAARAATLHRTLDRVEGRVEYGVKLYVDPPAEGASAGQQQRPPSGAEYLARRRQQLAAREEASRDAAELGDAVHAELSAMVVAARRYRPQEQRLSGHRGQMMLNGTYLVDTERADDLTALVDKLADRHRDARLELTGPWPPYSFTQDEQDEQDEEES